MGTLQLLAGSTTTCVSSGAGTIATGALQVANATHNLLNSTNLDFSACARLTCSSSSSVTQGTTVTLYLVPIADGSSASYVDISTPYISPNYRVGNFTWSRATGTGTSISMDIDGIPLSAFDYTPYLLNNLGVTIATTWSLVFYGTKNQY